MSAKRSEHKSRSKLMRATTTIPCDVASEATALLALIKKEQDPMSREELMTAVPWEVARFAYYQNMLPEFWKLTADKKRPESSLKLKRIDEIFDSEHFPNQWGQVPKEARQTLIKWLVGDQTTAARFLSGFEAASQARRFIKAIQSTGATKPPTCSKTLPMDDDGFVAILRVYPGCGWNMICKSIEKELKTTGWPQDGRRNANDVNSLTTTLKGLAALWLEKAGWSLPKQNQKLFPTQGVKYDYDLLKKAKKRARSEVDNLVQVLTDSCRAYTDLKAYEQQTDDEIVDAIRQAQMPKTKQKSRARSPLPQIPNSSR